MIPFIFGTLAIADILTTNLILANGGWEGNPIMALSITAFGVWWWLPKAGLTLVATGLMPRLKPKAAITLCGLMALVVTNNLLQI